VTETEFQEQVVELARLLGWRSMHVRRSIGKGRRWTTATSCAGWPDLTLWDPRAGGVLFVELKADRGVVSLDQLEVHASLRAAGADVRVWRPADWDEVEATLNRRQA
jgi:hypothetical protein